MLGLRLHRCVLSTGCSGCMPQTHRSAVPQMGFHSEAALTSTVLVQTRRVLWELLGIFFCEGPPLRTAPRSHQPPNTNRHQPPTATNLSYTRSFYKSAFQEHFFSLKDPPWYRQIAVRSSGIVMREKNETSSVHDMCASSWCSSWPVKPLIPACILPVTVATPPCFKQIKLCIHDGHAEADLQIDAHIQTWAWPDSDDCLSTTGCPPQELSPTLDDHAM